ncbi:hypothetical protein D3C76_1109630 [compost metagenome]
MFEQVEDQRGGDVVGQVADHAQLLACSGQGGEVEFQRIALVQGEVRLQAEPPFQLRDQVEVELDHVQPGVAVHQSFGQGTLARSDFQQMLSLARSDGAQDAMDHPGVVQEVLAEALARAVLIKLGHRRQLQAASFKPQAKSSSEKDDHFNSR